MVEPLAHLVKGSITRYPAITASARRKRLSRSFFTPLPRQHHLSSDAPDSSTRPLVAQCQEWSCCAVWHSLTCPNRDHAWNFSFESSPTTQRRADKPKHKFTKSLAMVYPGQRRHASVAVDSLPHPVTEEHLRPSEALERFRPYCRKDQEHTFDLSAAWKDYQDVVALGMLPFVASDELDTFAGNILAVVEDSVNKKGKIRADLVEEWTGRIRSLLAYSGSQTSSAQRTSSEYARQIQARLLALHGEGEELRQIIHEMRRDGSHAQQVRNLCVLAFTGVVSKREGRQVLEFLAREWDDFTERCMYSAKVALDPGMLAIRHSIEKSVRTLKEPLEIILSAKDPTIRHRLLELSVRAYLDRESYPLAAQFLIDASRHSLRASQALVDAIMTSLLAKTRRFIYAPLAQELLECYNTQGPELDEAVSIIASKAGQIVESEVHFTSTAGIIDDATRATRLLYAYAHGGDVSGTINIFNRHFPKTPTEGRQNNPSEHHYFPVFLALVRHGNGEGMEEWMEDMHANRVQPDSQIYSIFIEYYGQRDMVEQIISTFEQMDVAGVWGDEVVYNVAMAFFARRKDPVTVEALFRRMLRHGIEPNVACCTTLINAYVEAGIWTGVIKAFKYVKTYFKEEDLPIDIYNVLLKAYSRVGIPFDQILRQFWRIKDLGLEPDAYTYSTVVAAACDNHCMTEAKAIYDICQQKHEQNPSSGILNPHLFTSMIAGYTRARQYDAALEMYGFMVDSEIEPNAVTYGAIVWALVSAKGPEVGEEFVSRTILSQPSEEQGWKKLPYGKATWYELVYTPLFNAYRLQGSADNVMRLYQSIYDQGEEITLALHTQMLDSFRRSSDFGGVSETWDEIYEMVTRDLAAAEPLRDEETVSGARDAPAAILSDAVSIYIDACSAAGYHEKVQEAWDKLQKLNIRFSPHNWNHLGVAYVRAGEVSRAFALVEEVILPRRREEPKYQPTFEDDYDSPLVFDPKLLGALNSLGSTQYQRPSFRLSKERSRARIQNLPPKVAEGDEYADFADPLKSILNIQSAWTSWRPHGALLGSLLLCITRLEQGLTIRPITPGDRRVPAIEGSNPEEARKMLDSIMENYPQTFGEVMNFRTMQRKKYGRRYARFYERT
ncbi:hypothetical protein FA15DRAFT_759438 [Coprinopsis marcescibilis]|uniref:Pentacotripeptide-repeat region of PRORP domain-containing protein n=1 Tax=Coprinopsis marcescibilis TaxID=230819 RepID=A0A5C3KJR6_COPMA|nr:hypothetical protein FA15DRAFT_759438 [Coprinopsis marcescibilis]